MKRLLLLFGSLLLLLNAQAQRSGYYFSEFNRTITDTSDRAFLLRMENRVWHAADSGVINAYDNPAFDIEFRVRMTRSLWHSCIGDSFPPYSGTGEFRMILRENRKADTISVMAMNPYVHLIVEDPNNPTTYIPSKRLLATFPLGDYPKVMSAGETERTKRICRDQLAAILGGKVNGDTIVRVVRFINDSNEYLPQADYRHLAKQGEDELLSGQINAYRNSSLDKKLTKRQIEESFVYWDSTAAVEDPNNPATFILVPLRYNEDPVSFVLLEKWIPCPASSALNSYMPAPFMNYTRVVSAYGILLSSGKIIWLQPEQLEQQLAKDQFDFTPYQECFRAERYLTLRMQP